MTDPGTADVQAELQDYLNSKNINTLFIQIVESLLIEKPDNPIGFIVEYLQKKYPDQAGPIPSAATASEAKGDFPADEDEEESEPESDDDYVGDLQEPEEPPKVVNRGQRRVSVSAESPNAEMAKTNIKVIPKNEEETNRILEILKKNVLFKHLDEQQMGTVKDAMFLVSHNKDDVIIKQGDDGDNFYVVDSGTVDVYVNTPEGELKVLDYSNGDSFGELAIMYNAPRAATCKATSDVKLWALDRVSFKVILMTTTISKRNVYKGFLQQVPILSQLTEYEILTIADALQEETFTDGAVICKQGDAGDTFYIIKEGEAVCTQKGANGEDVVVAKLGNGAYFGEIALLTSKPRQATVSIVGSNFKCLTLDRKTFKRVMGPLQDILMRNLEQYNKFQAANI
jgi:cAMP-dependent protein kinase regulator